jgi:hypothetical protein
MKKLYSTWAEVRMKCRMIASTDENIEEYQTIKNQIQSNGLSFVIEWENLAIYSDGLYYILVYHNQNLCELYKKYSRTEIVSNES